MKFFFSFLGLLIDLWELKLKMWNLGYKKDLIENFQMYFYNLFRVIQSVLLIELGYNFEYKKLRNWGPLKGIITNALTTRGKSRKLSRAS